MCDLKCPWPLLILLLTLSSVLESNTWSKNPILLPGEELLLLDAPAVSCKSGTLEADTELPLQFRRSDTLNASGSAQFSVPQLKKVLAQSGGNSTRSPARSLERNPPLLIDLRQEPHGYLNDAAVSWYGADNAINATRPNQEIERDEAARLRGLLLQQSVTLKSFVSSKNPESCPVGEGMDLSLPPNSIATEADLVTQLGASYLRIPVPDHQRPKDRDVDLFLSQVKGLSPETWIHFHCEAGKGRTTTFLVLYDILRNCTGVSLSAILERQKRLGGSDLQDTHSKTDPRRKKWAMERFEFIQQFYKYCLGESPTFRSTWSNWSKSRKGNK